MRDDARRFMKRRDPNPLSRYKAHVTQLMLRKRYDLAEPAIRKVLSLAPDDPDANRQLSSCLLSLRRLDEEAAEQTERSGFPSLLNPRRRYWCSPPFTACDMSMNTRSPPLWKRFNENPTISPRLWGLPTHACNWAVGRKLWTGVPKGSS